MAGGLLLRGGASVAGVLDLSGAELGHINDDARCWPAEGDLLLDRCRYGAFTGRAPVDATSRLEWLGRQDPARSGAEFWPQPYEQLAKVLREMGHAADARTVLVEKERLQREARRGRWQARLDGARLRLRVERCGLAAVRPAIVARLDGLAAGDPRRGYLDEELRKSPEVRRSLDRREAGGAGGPSGSPVATGAIDRVSAARAPIWDYWWRLNLLRLWDGIVGVTVGYGRQPERAALWAAGFLLLGWFIFAWAVGNGAIKPNSVVVLRGAEWTDCAENPAYASQLACYHARSEARSYPRFNPLIYSADTLLPIVDLEMQDYWIPDERSWRGWLARSYLWAHIAIGWALSLLAVAGFSGLVRSD